MSAIKPAAFIVGTILLIAAAVLAWWLIIGRTRAAQTDAAASTVQAVAADHGEKAATQALKITLDVNQRHAAGDALTQENDRAIKAAGGASASIDPAVARALHDALCMRAAYQSEPDCAALQTADRRVGVAATDTGSSPTNR